MRSGCHREKRFGKFFYQTGTRHYATEEEDCIVDTYVLDELRLPHKLGGDTSGIYVSWEKITRTFRVCGWYEGNRLGHASELYVSEAFWNQLKGNLTDRDFKKWARKIHRIQSVGLYSVGLYFESPKNSETVRSVIRKQAIIQMERMRDTAGKNLLIMV